MVTPKVCKIPANSALDRRHDDCILGRRGRFVHSGKIRSSRWRPRRDQQQAVIAEDDSELRSLMALALEADGYDVHQVEDGWELVELLGELCRVDVIISDVRMPRGGGLEALVEFRQCNWSTPFVLITAFGSADLHQEALELGASAVFDKPFEMDELRGLVRRLVPRSPEARPI
jgi:DNA-binding response OmpR family regulator